MFLVGVCAFRGHKSARVKSKGLPLWPTLEADAKVVPKTCSLKRPENQRAVEKERPHKKLS